mmetsp:Transcript_8993/g.10425  ORF Transcript_8993/g.10425 Transcript_8993/m.10425 type:complete len:81 (-) Transcript_8993:25-267(-)
MEAAEQSQRNEGKHRNKVACQHKAQHANAAPLAQIQLELLFAFNIHRTVAANIFLRHFLAHPHRNQRYQLKCGEVDLLEP